ncbi:MAG: 23S rRNA pseudouridine2457 synthase [Arenicella sp.]
MHRHFIVHKPFGYLSQFVANGKTKSRHKYLGELHGFPEGTMSIGRLDISSEGLLFLTTDGQMSHEVRSKKVEKEYYVQVDGIITSEALIQLKEGIEITTDFGPYTTLPANVKIIEDPNFGERLTRKVRDDRHGPTSWISVIISEGKFRQVRKMTAAVGFPTLRLVRVRIGQIKLEGLALGEVKEVDHLLK